MCPVSGSILRSTFQVSCFHSQLCLAFLLLSFFAFQGYSVRSARHQSFTLTPGRHWNPDHVTYVFFEMAATVTTNSCIYFMDRDIVITLVPEFRVSSAEAMCRPSRRWTNSNSPCEFVSVDKPDFWRAMRRVIWFMWPVVRCRS